MPVSRPLLAITPYAAAASGVVAGLLEPDFVDASAPDSTASSLTPGLQWLAANPDAGWAASLLSALALALLGSWALRLGRLPSERGRRLARIGGTVAGVALLLAGVANVAIGALRVGLGQPPIAGQGAAEAYADVVNGSTFAVLFLPGLLLAPIAGVLLVIGLGRSALVPWWAAVPAGLLVAAVALAPFGRIGSAIVVAVLAAPVAVALLAARTDRRRVAQLDPAAA